MNLKRNYKIKNFYPLKKDSFEMILLHTCSIAFSTSQLKLNSFTISPLRFDIEILYALS